MKSLQKAKIWIAMGLLALLIACAPKRKETEFAKNKIAEAGQTYTEDQLRSAIGSAQYDQLVAGIGADNLNLLTYGVGISNMSQMINGITGPGKLVSLMSDGLNSKKLTALEVLDLLNKLDDACQQQGSFGTDTLGKMVNMINNVTLAGMEGIKNIVHGLTDTTPRFNDPNGVSFNNPTARLGLMLSLLNESLSVMPTLVNDLASPRCSLPQYTTAGSCSAGGGSWTTAGVFSASGNAKLIRLVNNTKDMRDLAVIINNTTNLSNITAVMAGLTGNVYCSKPQYGTLATCPGGLPNWTNTNCSNSAYETRASCTAAGATWTADGIENMARIINELDRVCSNATYTDGTTCLNAGAVWHTKASKIPVIVNDITVTSNMYAIVNGLTNDGKRPPWPTGLPAAYPGDAGNAFDGVDSMVATLNAINVPGMGDPATSNTIPFGQNGIKRLAYMVNNLDTTPIYGNDSNFDTGTDCTNGLFDNRLNWAFSNNQTVSGSPWYGGSWRSGAGAGTFQGTCSLRNDNTAATVFTQTQSAELIANLTVSGSIQFYTRECLGTYDTVRFYVDDVELQTFTGNTCGAFSLRGQAVTAGLHRFRWDVQRALNSTGQFFLDTVTLPGEKGAPRTAAEKTFIMMNNLYINSSLTNVADLLNAVNAPACVDRPSATVTISSATPGLVTWAAHPFVEQDAVVFSASATLPSPLVAGTTYYVKNVAVGQFNLSATPGGAAINTATPQATVTISQASPGTVFWPSHTVAEGQPVSFTSSGTLPAGLTSGITYYAKNVQAGQFNLSSTPGGAAINTTSAGSGIFTGSQLAGTITGQTFLGTCAPTNADGLDALIYTVNRSEYPGGPAGAGIAGNVTIPIGAPAVVTWNGHSLAAGTAVKLTSSGTLPSPLDPTTVYYVIAPTANTFNLSISPSGSTIATTTAGSGSIYAVSLPRLAVTVNKMSSITEMTDVLKFLSGSSYQQLSSMMDFVQTPTNIPDLINGLSTGGGAKTAAILSTLNAAGTSNMIRVMADTPAGASVADVVTLINGLTVPNASQRVAEILNNLKLTANVYDTTSNASVTISAPATPAVVTWTGHNLIQNGRISFSTTGKLPTGMFSGRVYYVCPTGANTFNISTDLTCTALVATTAAGSGTHSALAGDETAFQLPNVAGGVKLAQFFNQINTVKAANSNTCNTGAATDFCVAQHLVRLVNDIATSTAGSQTVAGIVSNLRPNAGPGGNTGVVRMVDTIYQMRVMNSGTPYTDPLSNSTAENFGRLTAFIKDMTGAFAGLNTARMVNEVQLGYITPRVVYLLQNINRMRYLSRMLSEMTSVDLMLALLNDATTNIASVNTLVNTHGNGTYGVALIGNPDPSPKYGANPSGTGCTTSDCDTNTTDQLGRLIQMINNIYAIGNTLKLINNTQDISYISYLINNVTREKYLTDIVNNLTNVDLMVKVINGSDACSKYVVGVNDTAATDTQAICTGGSVNGVWFGVGRCTTLPTRTLRGPSVAPPAGTCLGDGGTWHGADQTKLKDLLNGLGTAVVKGSGAKNVGDMFTLYDVMNKLGYNGATARTSGQQVRVVRTVNGVDMCGVQPQYDKYIQYPPTCVDGSGVVVGLNFQYKESCTAAGYYWRSKQSKNGSAGLAGWDAVSSDYYTCGSVAADGTVSTTYTPPTATLVSGGYYNNNDKNTDARPRLLRAMLNVNDGTAFSYIVGDVQDTAKTINMMNSVRRINAITTLVNLMPGPVTAALVNDTDPVAVTRSLVYMANNLDDDENETAKAFASMIHFGTRIVPQGGASGAATCLEFTAIGPRRMAAVLNLEAGPYLEALLSALGWQMSIAAMNCGWNQDATENTGCGVYTNGSDTSDGANGGMQKNVGASYIGNPKPASASYCVRNKEFTAGYHYGSYSWASAYGTNGVTAANCQSILPWQSGGSAVITVQNPTDQIIWNGMSTTVGNIDDGLGSNGCPGTSCSDMWSILKGNGSGIVGWVMTLGTGSSWVGFPPPRYDNSTAGGLANGRPDGSTSGTACTSGSDNADNWQCIRCGLVNSDLASNGNCSNGTGTSFGRYYGNFCSGANATGAQATPAKNCFANGGTWKAIKNYAQTGTCKLDPTVNGRVGP